MRELTEKRLEDLSDLAYQVFTCPMANARSSSHTAMIVAFEGEYGIGSAGNDDARFMIAVITTALTAWYSHALVIDLSRMDYEWGDGLTGVFNARGDRFKPVPLTAIVAADHNREAIIGLLRFMRLDPDIWLFPSRENAIAAVEERGYNQ